QDGELCAWVDERSPRSRGVRVRHRTLVDQEVGQLKRDVVEHDGGDHLMRPEAGLEKTWHRRPDEAAEHPESQRQRDVDDARRAGQAVAGQHPEDRAEVELTLGADVEQAGAETQSHRQPQENIGSHGDQRLGEGARVGERALEERGEGGEGIRARDDHRHTSHYKTACDRDDRYEDRCEQALTQRAAHPQAAPAISSPMRSRSASLCSKTAMTRPRYTTATRSASDRTSSSSDDTRSTPMPLSRSSTRRRWMNSIEPT